MREAPRIGLIVMDIDGTLVDDQKNVPPPNRRALQAALARGVHVAIASGRMIPSIARVEAQLGLDCALIAYNGGKVVGPPSDGRPCISHRPVLHAAALRVLEFARRHEYLLNYYVDDVLYAERRHENSPFADLYYRRTGSEYRFTDLDRVAGRPPTKLILLSHPADLTKLRQQFHEEMAGQVNVLITDPEYLEFMDVAVDKATALPELAGYYGLEVENVLAVGDADNDLRMVQSAGIGVAVANAKAGVLDAAAFVTRRSNNEGAVAEAVERWVLGEGALAGLWD